MKQGKSPKTAVMKALKALDADPVAELVAVAMDAKKKDSDARKLAVRVKAWSELLQYCQPKLRAMDVTVMGDKDRPLQLAFDWDALLRPSGAGQ